LSQQTRYARGEIGALLAVSQAYTFAGDYSDGLRAALEALKKSEQINVPEQVAGSLWSIAASYDQQGDHERALQYRLRIRDIVKLQRPKLVLPRNY